MNEQVESSQRSTVNLLDQPLPNEDVFENGGPSRLSDVDPAPHQVINDVLLSDAMPLNQNRSDDFGNDCNTETPSIIVLDGSETDDPTPSDNNQNQTDVQENILQDNDEDRSPLTLVQDATCDEDKKKKKNKKKMPVVRKIYTYSHM